MVRATVGERTIDGCTAVLEFDTGGPVGSDHLLLIEPTGRDDEDWLVNRWFYFDEQVERYAWNFAEKSCTDEEYRRQSLAEEADWARVANTYEPLARQRYEPLSEAPASDFPIVNDRSRADGEQLEERCRELFEEVREIVRNGKDRHPEAVYEEQEAALRTWLDDHYSGPP